MSRIRVVKGTYTKISAGDHLMFAEGNIATSASETINELGSENGVSYGLPNKIKDKEERDFNITFSLNKEHRTVVALGILNFDNQYENPFFCFNYSLSLSNVEELRFEIRDGDGQTIYMITNIEPVIVTATKKTGLYKQLNQNLPAAPVKSWDYQNIFDQYNLGPGDYTQVGSYLIYWDGFDNNGIFDSTRFNNKTLKAIVTAVKGGKEKSLEVEFSTEYKQVDWVDVKIDRANHSIHTTLRVTLEDGGDSGLKGETLDLDPDPKTYVPKTVFPWERIPASVIIKTGLPPLRTRTKSFSDLEQLAIDGLNYHWSRNDRHTVAKDVKVGAKSYKTFMQAVSTKEKAVGAMKLIYNTNGSWKRSGNPGSIQDPLTLAGNLVSRQAICYNVGYISSFDWTEFYKGTDWRYTEDANETITFKETAAHEIGHEILKQYGGTNYSYGHKGTVNPILQNENSKATTHPKTGEVDLMPYYTDWLPYAKKQRIAAAEKDVLSLIWLTKINIK